MKTIDTKKIIDKLEYLKFLLQDLEKTYLIKDSYSLLCSLEILYEIEDLLLEEENEE